MLEINSQSNSDDIKKVVSKIGKEVIEFNIIWLNFITRKKIIFLISEILKKYNIEKYNDDIATIFFIDFVIEFKRRYYFSSRD